MIPTRPYRTIELCEAKPPLQQLAPNSQNLVDFLNFCPCFQLKASQRESNLTPNQSRKIPGSRLSTLSCPLPPASGQAHLKPPLLHLTQFSHSLPTLESPPKHQRWWLAPLLLQTQNNGACFSHFVHFSLFLQMYSFCCVMAKHYSTFCNT